MACDGSAEPPDTNKSPVHTPPEFLEEEESQVGRRAAVERHAAKNGSGEVGLVLAKLQKPNLNTEKHNGGVNGGTTEVTENNSKLEGRGGSKEEQMTDSSVMKMKVLLKLGPRLHL